jgi:hypothetical protein
VRSSSCVYLNWNYSGQILGIGQITPLKLILTVNSNLTGVTDFTFDTTITTTNES